MYLNDNQYSSLTYIETILFSVGIYLFKVNNKHTRKRCAICPKLMKKDIRTTSIDMNTLLIDVALVSFFLTLTYFASCSTVSYVNVELVNVSWEFC